MEQAGRQAACPGEEVTFTCVVTESVRLRWIAEPFILQSDSVQFSVGAMDSDMSMDPSGLFTAVLDSIELSGGVADFTSRLIVTASVSGQLNGAVVQCSGQPSGLIVMSRPLFIAGTMQCTCDYIRTYFQLISPSLAPPTPPQHSEYSVSLYSLDSFTVAVHWESPASDGGVGINSYTLTGAGITAPLTVLSNEPLMATLTLSYNEMHMVSITASNCAGESTASLVTILEGESPESRAM